MFLETMRWLIDGYNVIRRDAELRAREAESLEAGRAALLRLIARVARASGEAFTVVFDGGPVRAGTAGDGQVQVLFSRHPETADDLLIKLAAQWREGAVIVSSDRAVQTAARRAGAVALAAETFLSAVVGDAPDGADDVDPETSPPSKRGNPRRPSKDERSARRVLARLRRR